MSFRIRSPIGLFHQGIGDTSCEDLDDKGPEVMLALGAVFEGRKVPEPYRPQWGLGSKP